MKISEKEEMFLLQKQAIESADSIDDRLNLAIQFMQKALSEGQKARFRDFWKMKKLCLELFKSEIHKTKRAAYWEEYTALLAEAHALQKIVEEQVSFQAQQLLLAIEGLEQEYQKAPKEVQENETLPFSEIEDSVTIALLQKQSAYFEKLKQKALSLRKEILALEVRISQKNQILLRLAKVSDQIFPTRKKLLRELSQKFDSIVLKFVQTNFDLKQNEIHSDLSFFQLRMKIKAFQSALKEVLITNDIYRKIRNSLGECWDLIANQEKSYKQSQLERKENAPEEVHEELEKINDCHSPASFKKIASEAIQQIKRKGVSKEAFYLVKQALAKKEEALENELVQKREEEKLAKEKKKKESLEKLEEAKQLLQSLRGKAKRLKLESLEKQFQEARSLISIESISESDSLSLIHQQEMCEKLLLEKKEKEGIEVSNLYMQLYHQMKSTMEKLRLAKEKCGLDIEYALELGEYLDEKREALVTIEEKL